MSTRDDDASAFPFEALRAGDPGAWDAFARRWDGPLRAFLYRLSGDSHAADELASETLVRAWKSRASIRDDKLSTWLFGIAMNLLRNRRRWWVRRARWLVGVDDENPTHTATDTGHTPDHALLHDERARRVREAVLALPLELREAMVLATYEQLPQADIAAALNLTVKAVEHRLARARTKLAQTLGDLRHN